MDKGGEGEKPKVVVDASVAVKWVIPGEPWEEQAVALKDMVVTADRELEEKGRNFAEIVLLEDLNLQR